MTAAAFPLLSCRGVVKRYGAATALDGADLEVRAGEVHALLGENGAGKSTLLKTLSGAEAADGGETLLDGIPYAPARPADAFRAGVATIHQELAVALDLSVEDNLFLGRESARAGFLRRAAERGRVREVLARLGHPDLDPRRRVRDLAPAARQSVEIARALLFDARLVIMDEPTSSLSRADAERLFGVVRGLARAGRAVIYVSHFLDEVRAVADRYTVLRDGRTAGAGAVADATVGGWIELMAGRRVEEFYPRGARTPGEVVLEARDVAGRERPLAAGFALRRGEVFGVAGLVGAGRTELFRALYGLDPVVRGKVLLRGGEPGRGAGARVLRGMGLLSEDRKEEGLALDLGLAENATLSRLSPYRRAGFVDRARRDAAAEAHCDAVGVKRRGPRQRVRELSGGNQQKVAFARLLHQEADVLLLDEPTRGVDVRSKAELYRLIDAAARGGKAVLVASSYPPELMGVCDRIAVMRRGVLGEARPVAAWSESSLAAAAAVGEEPETRDD